VHPGRQSVYASCGHLEYPELTCSRCKFSENIHQIAHSTEHNQYFGDSSYAITDIVVEPNTRKTIINKNHGMAMFNFYTNTTLEALFSNGTCLTLVDYKKFLTLPGSFIARQVGFCEESNITVKHIVKLQVNSYSSCHNLQVPTVTFFNIYNNHERLYIL